MDEEKNFAILFADEPIDSIMARKSDPVKVTVTVNSTTTCNAFRQAITALHPGLNGVALHHLKLIYKGKSMSPERGEEYMLRVMAEHDSPSFDNSVQHPVYCLVPAIHWKKPQPSVPMVLARSTPPLQPAHPVELKESTAAPRAPFGTSVWEEIRKAYEDIPISNRQTVLMALLTLKDYLKGRLANDIRRLGLPQATHLVFAMPQPNEEPAEEARIQSLIDEFKLSFILTAFLDLVPQDVSKGQILDIKGAKFLLKLEDSNRKALWTSLRTYQAYLSIIECVFHSIPQFSSFSYPYSSTLSSGLGLFGSTAPHPISNPSIPRFGRNNTEPILQRRMQEQVAAAGGGAPAAMHRQPVNRNGAPRANALAVVINLDELRRMLIPLFWITAKLSFLLYIFGRHASSSKRMVMGCMALTWIIWEAWSMRARRAAEGRRQMHAIAQGQGQLRELPEQDPAAGHARPAPAPRRPPVVFNGLQPGVIIQRAQRQNGATVPLPQTLPNLDLHRRYRHRSMWTTSYWINRVAAAGLATEARSMGMSTLTRRKIALAAQINGEPVPEHREREREDRTKQWSFILTVMLVLFIGTLIPEVERRRKRAIEKRERLFKALQDNVADLERQLADRPVPVSSATPSASVQQDTHDQEAQLEDRLTRLAEEDSRAPSPVPAEGPLPVPAPQNDRPLDNPLQLQALNDEGPVLNDLDPVEDVDDQVGMSVLYNIVISLN